MKAVYPSMKKVEQGSIINVSSAATFVGTPNTVAYTASKFAIMGMTKVAAKEFGEDDIRVNSVHPGPVATGMFNIETQEEQAKALPMGRVGEEEEITNMIVYLASDESTYSTGSEFTVDGGMTT
jgi:3alpha(or 20beta)-hydroxysteroid dehydrogenase